MRLSNLVVIVSLLCFGAVAAEAQATDARKRPAKVKSYDFAKETIDGAAWKSLYERIDVGTPSDHANLIKIRQHFVPELVKSAEDL